MGATLQAPRSGWTPDEGVRVKLVEAPLGGAQIDVCGTKGMGWQWCERVGDLTSVVAWCAWECAGQWLLQDAGAWCARVTRGLNASAT